MLLNHYLKKILFKNSEVRPIFNYFFILKILTYLRYKNINLLKKLDSPSYMGLLLKFF